MGCNCDFEFKFPGPMKSRIFTVADANIEIEALQQERKIIDRLIAAIDKHKTRK